MKNIIFFVVGVVAWLLVYTVPGWINNKSNMIKNIIEEKIQQIPDTTVGDFSWDMNNNQFVLYNVVYSVDSRWVPDIEIRNVYITIDFKSSIVSSSFKVKDIRLIGIRIFGYEIVPDGVKYQIENCIIGALTRET